MKNFVFAILTALALVFSMPLGAADIDITRQAQMRNPTLLFKGVSGDNALSNRVRSTLSLCGWFDLVSGGEADYVVTGSSSGDTLTLDLANGAGVAVGTYTGTGATESAKAHKAVDALLADRFGIKGICCSKIVFAASTGKNMKDVYVCDFDGRNIKRITSNATLSIEPVWTPDGKSIIYSFFGRGSTKLIQYDVASTRSRVLTTYNGINAGGAVSPDGKTVALVLAIDNKVDLYVRNLDGGKLKRLTNDRAVEASPCWSPDGQKICFVSDASSRPVLYVIEPFGSARPVMVRGIFGSERVSPDWSSDGKIAYCAKVGGQYTIAAAEMKGGTATPVQVGDGRRQIPGENPSWAPDNRHVVLSYKNAVYVVDTRLGRVRKLLSGASATSQPDWSPLLSE